MLIISMGNEIYLFRWYNRAEFAGIINFSLNISLFVRSEGNLGRKVFKFKEPEFGF